MAELVLVFTGDREVALERTEFRYSFGERSITASAQRGQIPVAKDGTFGWSSAVRALCVFFLNTRLIEDQGEKPVILQGGKGSLAASLDYAISKTPAWLCEMFACDQDGRSLLRRIIAISNTNLKRQGPVVLRLNEKFLSPGQIRIFREDQEITTPQELRRILDNILAQIAGLDNRTGLTSRVEVIRQAASSFAPRGILVGAEGSAFSDPLWRNYLKEMLGGEIRMMLSTTDIFSRNGYRQELEAVAANESFVKVAGRRSVSEVADSNLPSSARLGVPDSESDLRRGLDRSSPVTVVSTLTLAPTIAIFKYLKCVKGFNIELNYSFPHTCEIVKRIVEKDFCDPPDLCVLGLAPAAVLLSSGRSCDYAPFMLMPKASNRFVMPPGESLGLRRNLNGRFLLPTDNPTSASFCFDDLCRSRSLSRVKSSVACLEPDEIITEFLNQDPDVRSILWFPHYHFYRVLYGCRTHVPFERHRADLLTIMFAHRRFLEDGSRVRALSIAVRDAWLSLQSGGEDLEIAVSLLVEDQQYLKLLQRFTGLYHFTNEKLEEVIRNGWDGKEGNYPHPRT